MAKQKYSQKKSKGSRTDRRHLTIHRIYVCVALLAFILVVSGCLLALETPTVMPIEPTPTLTQTSHRATNRTEITHGDASKKQVIFTFDGGSGDGSTKEILEALAKHRVKGTFFLTGGWVKENPEWVKKIVAEGHEIFNHSYSHPYFTQITDAQIADELKKMDDLLFATAGVRTQPYFRPPYGDRNTRSNDAAFAAGYRSIYWSIDSLDWRPGETDDTIWNRVMPLIHPGAIILMHVGNTPTGKILDKMLTTLEAQGYTAVSLTQGL